MTSGVYFRTEKHKRNIGKSNTGKKRTQKIKNEMCVARSGKKNPMHGKGYLITGEKNGMYGKKQTKKAKEKNRREHIGENNSKWRGNKYQKDGYWFICIKEGTPRMRLSRHIAEQYLGRKLSKGECVHHINEDPLDDRPENLYVFPTKGKHTRQHNLKNPLFLISNLIL